MSSSRSIPKSTLQTVAKKAGVSQATVSLILNGRGKELRISDETCSKVNQAAKDLNYQANYFARSLRGKPTYSLAILWFFSGPHGEDTIIRRMTETALEHGYIAHFFDSMSDRDITLKILKELSRRSVDGIILRLSAPQLLESPENLKLLESFRATVIVAQDFHKPFRDLVQHARDKAMHAAVKHLVGTNRKRIIMLGVQGEKFNIAEDAWLNYGGQASDITWVKLDWYRLKDRIKGVAEALEPIPWTGPNRYDALLCSADEIAFIAINYFRSKELKVPEDIAVIGFNDSEASAYFHPSLSSVSREDDLVADKALEFLFKRLEEPDFPPQKATVDMKFVLRASA